ncbi:MAG: type II secretion system major pseudopilin GspG [Pirellula sp.]
MKKATAVMQIQYGRDRDPLNRLMSLGFTLMEMLVVLAIIGMIVGLVGPRILGTVDREAPKLAATQAKLLRGAIENFRLDIGRYPTQLEGLAALIARPSDASIASRWRGPYLDGDLPLDPWKNPYIYSIPGAAGRPFALYSLGSDGKRGGEGDAADIGMLPGT